MRSRSSVNFSLNIIKVEQFSNRPPAPPSLKALAQHPLPGPISHQRHLTPPLGACETILDLIFHLSLSRKSSSMPIFTWFRFITIFLGASASRILSKDITVYSLLKTFQSEEDCNSLGTISLATTSRATSRDFPTLSKCSWQIIPKHLHVLVGHQCFGISFLMTLLPNCWVVWWPLNESLRPQETPMKRQTFAINTSKNNHRLESLHSNACKNCL